MNNILIVEDEKNLADGLKFNLEIESYKTTVLETAEKALDIFSEYDMMILDIMLPGMNGIELLKKIRQMHPRFPVLILSAKSSEENMVEGLAAGADDYMTKPFSLPELILRVKRMLERHVWYAEATRLQSLFSFSKYWVNFESFEAMTNKGKIRLTQYECYVMKYLIENRERSVSREELLEKVWGYSVAPETRTVDIFIARLRKLFEENSKSPEHLKSVRSIGYRFYK